MADLTINSKVSKTGDTVSGNYNLKRNDADISTVKSSYLMRNINWVDKNNVNMAIISGGQAPNDQTVLSFTAVNDSIQNYLYLLAKKDGTRSVTIEPNSVVPWRNALGASSGIWPTSLGGTGGTDSGWSIVTRNSTVYTNGSILYRRIGKFMNVYGVSIRLATELAGASNLELATIPNGYRPHTDIITAAIITGISGLNRAIGVQLEASGLLRLFSNVNNTIPTTAAIGFVFSYSLT